MACETALDRQRYSQRLRVVGGHLLSIDAESNTGQSAVQSACRAVDARARQSKVVTAAEAVACIGDDAVITTGGFVGCGCPEALLQALRQRFLSTAHPRNLHLVEVAVTGDRQGRGVDELALEGLVGKFTFGWTGNCPDMTQLIKDNKVQAWNLPLGIVSHMIRDAAGGRPGPISQIGLGTFVDPREQGGKLNKSTLEEVVSVVALGAVEYLHYKAPRINVALLRGTTADADGNVSFEKECFYADTLNQAIAAHNSGGLVIVQVERVAASGSLQTRSVHLPAALVDKIVVAPPELHWQSMASPHHDASLSGEIRRPLSAVVAMPLDVRKVIAHRCMLALDAPHAIVNLGVGMPEGVGLLVSTHAERDCPHILPVTLSTEVGLMGGIPGGGHTFGAARNADALLMTSTMIDLIQGGGLDVCILGCAEVDWEGNVNVSKFSGRNPGCGGFVDISQSAKQVIFSGTFTSGGLQNLGFLRAMTSTKFSLCDPMKHLNVMFMDAPNMKVLSAPPKESFPWLQVRVADGKLQILREGRVGKFRQKVQEKTFAGSSCGGRKVLFVTERCVFRLLETPEGSRVELIEIAPGVRLKEDVLDLMEFLPVVRDVRVMDERCFRP